MIHKGIQAEGEIFIQPHQKAEYAEILYCIAFQLDNAPILCGCALQGIIKKINY